MRLVQSSAAALLVSTSSVYTALRPVFPKLKIDKALHKNHSQKAWAAVETQLQTTGEGSAAKEDERWVTSVHECARARARVRDDSSLSTIIILYIHRNFCLWYINIHSIHYNTVVHV